MTGDRSRSACSGSPRTSITASTPPQIRDGSAAPQTAVMECPTPKSRTAGGTHSREGREAEKLKAVTGERENSWGSLCTDIIARKAPIRTGVR